jgi:8-oxo-dGTP pyrophosphatase MutT (NUDIX family)
MARAIQGGWETDETVEAAAERETIEEAGVRGVLEVCTIWPPLACNDRSQLLHSHPCCQGNSRQ